MNKIISVRNKELHHLTSSMYLGAAVSFTFICAPFLVRKLKLHYFRIYPLGCRCLGLERLFLNGSLVGVRFRRKKSDGIQGRAAERFKP